MRLHCGLTFYAFPGVPQDEMLGGLRVEGQWSVLLLDDITTQIMTNICGVADLLDYGISCEVWAEFSCQLLNPLAGLGLD